MHSSRMRTARLLPVSPSMHCGGGGGVCSREEVGGSASVRGGGEVVSDHVMGQTPPWTEFLKHASENITLPQLRCGL